MAPSTVDRLLGEIHVACHSCRKTFEATLHAGLVRCADCTDAHALRLPGGGGARTVVL